MNITTINGATNSDSIPHRSVRALARLDDEDFIEDGSALDRGNGCEANENCNIPFQYCHRESGSVVDFSKSNGECKCMSGRKLNISNDKCICTDEGRKNKEGGCRSRTAGNRENVCDRLKCENGQKCARSSGTSPGYFCDCKAPFYGERCDLEVGTPGQKPKEPNAPAQEEDNYINTIGPMGFQFPGI